MAIGQTQTDKDNSKCLLAASILLRHPDYDTECWELFWSTVENVLRLRCSESQDPKGCLGKLKGLRKVVLGDEIFLEAFECGRVFLIFPK